MKEYRQRHNDSVCIIIRYSSHQRAAYHICQLMVSDHCVWAVYSYTSPVLVTATSVSFSTRIYSQPYYR